MLIFCDSFDDRAVGHIGDRYDSYVYNESAGSAIVAGRTDRGLALSTGILDVFDRITYAFSQRQTIFTGVATKSSLSTALISIRYNTTAQIYAQLNADRTISVIRSGTPDVTLGTSTKKVTEGAWFYVELMGKIHSSTGAYELRVDGQRWLSASGVNTSSTGDALANQVRLTHNHSGTDGAIRIVDDFYIADDDSDGGDALVTGFAGSVKIACLQPEANGDTNEWTPSAGSNFDCVNSPVDDETSYTSGTTGQTDLYEITDMTVVVPEIRGAMLHLRARKEDALYRGIIPTVKVASTEYTDTETELTTSYAQVLGVFERNPATGAAWTYSEINALQVGASANT